MRVLFTVSNWPGHYYPLVPLGWALQAAGHQVRVACTEPDAEQVSRAGLTPVAVLDAPDMVFQARMQNYLDAQQGLWPYPAGPLHPFTGQELASLDDFDCASYVRHDMRRLIMTPARRSTDAAVALARQWRPDLVVHELLSLEGLLAAKVTGVPAVLHLWGPVGPTADGGVDLFPLDLSRAFPRHGVGELTAGLVDYVIDPCPEDLRPPVMSPRLPVRYVPYNGPGPMPRWVLRPPGRPRVCVVWGNSVTRMFGRVAFAVPKVVEALADLDAEVVLTMNQADVGQLGPLPRNVTALEHVPLHLLLPTCDAVVHNGGAGCAMTSVSAGVPQLLLPAGFDQRLISDRLAAAGAGIRIDNHRADAGAIRSALTSLLDGDGYRAPARRLRRQMARNPAPAQLVTTLEELARSSRPAAAAGSARQGGALAHRASPPC
jgi:UDP:flavonoid glycosyltransferase YjiC (YdhE family)